mgnify:CR=1 FL=1
MIRFYQMSDVGLKRHVNEDSILCRPPSDFVVADGMGGHVAGEIASYIFTITGQYRQQENNSY